MAKQATRADIYFEDECPRIGCGWRRVFVKVGRKWVRIEEQATGRRARFKMKAWAPLGARARPVDC